MLSLSQHIIWLLVFTELYAKMLILNPTLASTVDADKDLGKLIEKINEIKFYSNFE